MRDGVTCTLDEIDEKFAGVGILSDTINFNIHYRLSSTQLPSKNSAVAQQNQLVTVAAE